jgi:hypothetical protein
VKTGSRGALHRRFGQPYCGPPSFYAMSKTTFSLTFSRLLADRERSMAWNLLGALLLLGAWCWWAVAHP